MLFIKGLDGEVGGWGVKRESRGAALCFQILGLVSGTCGGKTTL